MQYNNTTIQYFILLVLPTWIIHSDPPKLNLSLQPFCYKSGVWMVTAVHRIFALKLGWFLTECHKAKYHSSQPAHSSMQLANQNGKQVHVNVTTIKRMKRDVSRSQVVLVSIILPG